MVIIEKIQLQSDVRDPQLGPLYILNVKSPEYFEK